MLRHLFTAGALAAACLYAATASAQPPSAGQQAFGYQWGYSYNTHDWNLSLIHI